MQYSRTVAADTSKPWVSADLFQDTLECAPHTIRQSTGGICSEAAYSHLIDDEVLERQVGSLIALSPVKGFEVKVVCTIELAADL